MSAPIPKTAMVFAAGLGTRMRPITDTTPKPLVKVGARTLIDHCLDRLAENGVERAIVNVHWHADQIEAHLAPRKSPKILISDERAKLLDQGGGIKRALPIIGRDPFLLCNTDAFWIEGPASNIARLAEAFDPDAMDFLLLVAASAAAVGVDWPGDFTMSHDGRLAPRESRRVAPFVYTGVGIARPATVRERTCRYLPSRAVLSCGGCRGSPVRRSARRPVAPCRPARDDRRGGTRHRPVDPLTGFAFRTSAPRRAHSAPELRILKGLRAFRPVGRRLKPARGREGGARRVAFGAAASPAAVKPSRRAHSAPELRILKGLRRHLVPPGWPALEAR